MNRFVRGALLLLCAAVFALPVAGCGGCWTEDPIAKKKREEEEKKKKEQAEREKPKPDFEFGKLRALPHDDATTQNFVKPGHCAVTRQEVVANNFDFLGDLESSLVDARLRPVEVEHTPFHLEMSRPVALAKGQPRALENTYFIPRRGAQEGPVWLESVLRARSGGEAPGGREQFVTTRLEDYKYFFVVLSRDPDSYGYLKRLDTMQAPHAGVAANELRPYQVVLPKVTRLAPLPSRALCWTSIACLLWDDFSPEALSAEQRQALLDWLHWGGQLVISGPGSLDQLKTSFLADYLPADSAQSRNLTSADFAEFNARFSLFDKRGFRDQIAVLPDKPMLGVDLVPRPDPRVRVAPGAGGLVAERLVGRGRVVVTAFPLTNRQVVNWRGFDGFFNGCLLGRPGRNFVERELVLHTEWRSLPGHERDARFTTNVRYFTRDVNHLAGQNEEAERRRRLERLASIDSELAAESVDIVGLPGRRQPMAPLGERDPHLLGYRDWPQAGVAGWNDFSGAGDAARVLLREAAGISVPKRGFVLAVLAVYVLVLAPVNWGFFRLLGRVEWAWIAAPVLAIAGAVVVVRLAQLDIGFARGRTEVAVLEAHADYPRAHLTRYTALYSSLSTTYELNFEGDEALSQPFSADSNYRPLNLPRTVRFRRDKNHALRGFPVASNSTEMIHTERMWPLGGAFSLVGDPGGDDCRLANQTNLALEEAGVLRRLPGGQVECAYLGPLAARVEVPLKFAPVTPETPAFAEWADSPVMSENAGASGGIRLWRLAELARALPLRQGEVRLIGWTGAAWPDLAIRPAASQNTVRSLVLAHLICGEPPAIELDANLRGDIRLPDDNPPKDDDFAP